MLLFGALYVSSIQFYFTDIRARDATFTPGSGGGSDVVEITASVLVVDTTRNTATLRLSFQPHGVFASAPGVLSRPLQLSTYTITGSRDRLLQANRVVLPEEITVDLEGDVSDYPADRYLGRIDLDLAAPATGPGSTAPTPVPVRVNFRDSLRGLDAYATLDPSSIDGDVALALNVTRSRSTIAFAVFIMFATALVTAVVITVVSLMILQRRKFEFGVLGWIAGLLFALPAVRNIMPGVPSVGALSDFVVLFWSLGLLVAAMIWVAVTWMKNPVRP